MLTLMQVRDNIIPTSTHIEPAAHIEPARTIFEFSVAVMSHKTTSPPI